jgi:hypothetical protein
MQTPCIYLLLTTYNFWGVLPKPFYFWLGKKIYSNIVTIFACRRSKNYVV